MRTLKRIIFELFWKAFCQHDKFLSWVYDFIPWIVLQGFIISISGVILHEASIERNIANVLWSHGNLPSTNSSHFETYSYFELKIAFAETVILMYHWVMRLLIYYLVKLFKLPLLCRLSLDLENSSSFFGSIMYFPVLELNTLRFRRAPSFWSL